MGEENEERVSFRRGRVTSIRLKKKVSMRFRIRELRLAVG